MSNLQDQIQRLYARFVRVANSLQSVFLLLLRIYLGLWPAGIAINGWGKLHNLARVTQFFESLGLPAPGATAVFVSTFEFVGGILLALGLLSRVAALGLAIDMLTAYITADRDSLFAIFSNPSKFYNADPAIYLFFALIVLIFGPGKISLDYFLEKKYARNASFDDPHRNR